jgi:serine/threonine protein kinase
MPRRTKSSTQLSHLSLLSRSSRDEAPQGFALFPPGEPLEESAATRVFIVTREGASSGESLFVCKRLSTRARSDECACLRTIDEGRLLRALAGRGAPPWIAAGRDAHGPFVVMKHIEWPTLATRIGAHADAHLLARAAVASLRSLVAIHEARDDDGALDVVHGDVSPANILVDDEGLQGVMVDFGHSRWRDATHDARADSGTFGGTLLYTAPELARGDAIDARSDLFSWALSFLHAASGVAPRATELPSPALLVDAGERSLDSWAREASRVFALVDDESADHRELARALVACASFVPAARPASAREALVRANTAV